MAERLVLLIKLYVLIWKADVSIAADSLKIHSFSPFFVPHRQLIVLLYYVILLYVS